MVASMRNFARLGRAHIIGQDENVWNWCASTPGPQDVTRECQRRPAGEREPTLRGVKGQFDQTRIRKRLFDEATGMIPVESIGPYTLSEDRTALQRRAKGMRDDDPTDRSICLLPDLAHEVISYQSTGEDRFKPGADHARTTRSPIRPFSRTQVPKIRMGTTP